jgi:hypothetical protein
MGRVQMGWLDRRRSRRAAKAYATALGTSAAYKQGQIERGIRELRLDPDYALFGYALFLDRAAFEEARAALTRELGRRPQFDASSGGAGEDWTWPEGHGGHTHGDGGDGGAGGDSGGGGN